MRVHWTETAQGHLRAINRYIAQDSVEYARRVADRITQRSRQIADFPLSGRRVPEFESDEIREVVEGAYRVIYRVKPDQIDVLAVIHSARDLPRATEGILRPK